MKAMQIDPAIKSVAMPCHFRLRVLSAMIGAYADAPNKKKLNWPFWGHFDTYAGRELALPDGVDPGRDLWPPGIAALDYVVREVGLSERILDFGCGVGVLLAYLNHNGYDVWGYDNWSQLPKSIAVDFLHNFGLENGKDTRLSSRLLDGSLTESITIFVFTGGRWRWFTQEQQELLMPTLETILVDSRYSPEEILGFEKMAAYDDLLDVFKRR